MQADLQHDRGNNQGHLFDHEDMIAIDVDDGVPTGETGNEQNDMELFNMAYNIKNSKKAQASTDIKARNLSFVGHISTFMQSQNK